MTETFSDLPARVTIDGGVVRLTPNNPRRKNAITLEMAKLIEEFCDRVRDDAAIGAVLVDAVGDYFCSGADTRDLAASSADPASPEAVARTSAVYRAFVRIGELPVPTVALVVGVRSGLGSTSHWPPISCWSHLMWCSTAVSWPAESTPAVATCP